MNPEAPSSLDPLAQSNTNPAQPAPTEAPAAASPVEMLPPEPGPAPAQQPTAVIDASEPSPLKQIRTYQGDIAEAIKSQHESVYSMREAERARADLLKSREAASGAPAPVERTPMSEETKRRIVSMLLSLGGLLLLGGAGYAAYYAYQSYEVKTAVPVVEIPKNRFLPVVGTTNLDATQITRELLISTLATERSGTLAAGNIRQVQLTKNATASSTLMTPSEFLLVLSARPPSNLVRAFDPLFMLGTLGQPVVTVAAPAATTTVSSAASATSTATTTLLATVTTISGSQTILLMKLDSFDNAYAGMLGWEPNMHDDLLPLFQSADTVASVPSDTAWADATIKNKDARVLRDMSGKTELIYSFYNQNLLIITGSEAALRDIITELDTQALAR